MMNFKVYFTIILLSRLGAFGEPFQKELKKNVERYKYNNFRWNVFNLNADKFISLRDLEERKDKEFSEYLVQKNNVMKLQNTKYTRHGMLPPKGQRSILFRKEIKGSAEAVRSLADFSPQAMKYKSQLGESPLVMMYNDQLMTQMLEPLSIMYKDQLKSETFEPQTMMYFDPGQPLPMMYNAREKRSPRVMMYNDQLMTQMFEPLSMMYKDQLKSETFEPQTMMYFDPGQPLPMMYNAREKRSPRVMMYNDQLMTQMLEPLSMMYKDQLKSETFEPQTMMYFDPGQPLPMMYNAREKRSPRVMMYNDQLQTQMLEPLSMMYKDQLKSETFEPQTMMYLDPGQPQTMLYNAREKRSPRVMMYNDQLQTQMLEPLSMMYKDQLKSETFEPQTMMYFDPGQPLPMMYNAREKRSPRVMMYNDQLMTQMLEPLSMMYKDQLKSETFEPQTMMYLDPGQPLPMMYNEREKRSPRVMMYNDQLMTQMLEPLSMMYKDQLKSEIFEPQTMMYFDPGQPLPMMYNAREKRSPRVMMYNDQLQTQMLEPLSMMYKDQLKSETFEPQTMMYFDPGQPLPMMYNAREKRSPRVMMYNDQLQTQMLEPLSMMYKDQLKSETFEPQTMMYLDPGQPQTMLYNAREKRSPRVMMYNDQLMTQMFEPLSMMYKDQLKSEIFEPQTMMYFDPGQPLPMLYNEREKRSPQVMMYNDQLMTQMFQPFTMMYTDQPIPQKMMYEARKKRIVPDVVMEKSKIVNGIINNEAPNVNIHFIDTVPKSPDDNIPSPPVLDKQIWGTDRNASVEILSKNKDPVVDRTTEWFTFAKSLVKPIPKTADEFFRRWKHTISVFNERELSQKLFKSKFSVLGIKTLIQKIATSNVFEKLFWPFVFKNAFMNQKLGLLGLSGQSVPPEEQKSTFYEVLEKYQTIRIPFASDRIVLSFNDSDLIDGLHRSGLMETSKQYVDAGLHLYTQDEQTVIRHKVDAAMTMINKSMPELYRAIHQVIGCIAFYKAQRAGFAGGTVSSALGVIWQDPRAYKEQSVAHYAEQIVHEYIHSSLFLADLVHGTFADYNLLSRAKAYSPIKHELRDFDKVFHASYVSTGVAVFHARAGNWDKAQKLLEPLEVSVNDLDAINTEFGLLNDSGNAMLQAMKDFLTLIRLI